MIRAERDRLLYRRDKELLVAEACGPDGIRVRATQNATFDEALPSGIDETLTAAYAKRREKTAVRAQVLETDGGMTGELVSGALRCTVSPTGKLTFYNAQGELLLEEYERDRFREKLAGDFYSALEIRPREYEPIEGTQNYRLTAHFEAKEGERFYGMGQYQQPHLNLKGCRLELAQRNSQVTIPFVVSSRDYGFLWNLPAIGQAVFANNVTEWTARSARQLDFWVCAGETPARVVENYAAVSGTVPVMPEKLLGFWQCKLRYQTQEELLEVAREYKRRGIPLDVIVADFFHWPHQGDWKFDRDYWPEPAAMAKELREMGISLMVSVWPTVEQGSENYEQMEEAGYLIRTEAGKRDRILSGAAVLDATNPDCRSFVWEKLKRNYYDDGVRMFWLDEAEPELTGYEYRHYRFFAGSDLEVGNCYPREYARLAYEGMREQGQEGIVNLLRCAWAGSQKYGALVWSGDIDSSFASLRSQIVSGLHMGMAGIPWWTTDIGGFCGGDIREESFHELLVRWFEFGAFCPVMRLHGYRKPFQPPIGTRGGGTCGSGAANEIWSYGERVYEICKSYIALRERMKPYLAGLMREAHEKGAPLMRPLFYEFPQDEACWETAYEYMFGASLLVCPVVTEKAERETVYLPEGTEWIHAWSGRRYAGGQRIEIEAPLEQIPFFVRGGRETLLRELMGR